MMGLSPAAVLYDAAGNPVSVISDGGVYRISGVTKVLNSSGAQVNPATEGTLSSVDAWLALLDTTLDAIKDTDGIKKIVDTVSAQIAKGASDLVHLDAIDTGTGRGRLEATLLTATGDPVSFPSVSDSIKNDYLLNGTSPDLLVNGGTAPVVFSYDAHPTQDIALQEIRFTLASNSITFGNGSLGATSGPLANGLLLEVLTASGTVELYNFKQNEGFVNFSSPGGFQWVVSSKDMMTSGYVIGGGLVLRAGTTDKVRLTVRDNISNAGIYFKCFVKGNLSAA